MLLRYTFRRALAQSVVHANGVRQCLWTAAFVRPTVDDMTVVAQAVSRWPLTADTLVLARVTPYGMFGVRTGTGTEMSLLTEPPDSTGGCQRALVGITPVNIIIHVPHRKSPGDEKRPLEAAVLRRQSRAVIANQSTKHLCYTSVCKTCVCVASSPALILQHIAKLDVGRTFEKYTTFIEYFYKT
jgi:hypothetical protein